MYEQLFLAINCMATKEELQPYLQYKDFNVRYYARRRLRQLEEYIFNLEEV